MFYSACLRIHYPAMVLSDDIGRSIQEQAKIIREKQDQGMGRRLVEASAKGEDLMNHYRKIESLFRQLQVCLWFGTCVYVLTPG